MEEKSTIVLVNSNIYRILNHTNYLIQDFFDEEIDKDKIEIIDCCPEKDKDEFRDSWSANLITFNNALGCIKPYHKKLIIFSTTKIKKIIFEESDAKPCKELEIIIYIIDSTTEIFNNFIVNDYPVKYIFFSNLRHKPYEKYIVDMNEKITTQTFIDALEDETKYIKLSLKLHNKNISKNLKDVDFNKVNKIAFNSEEPVKIGYLNTEDDLVNRVQKIFRGYLPAGSETEQKFLNLKYFIDDSDYDKTINEIKNHNCINTIEESDSTLFYHRHI